MAKKEKNVACESESESESESEDESGDDEIDQHLARLSKKDKLMVLKLIEKIEDQEEKLHEQDEFVIKKIKCLEKLTKEYEKLKCSHAKDENDMLKDKVESLTSKNETLQESHENEELKEEVERLRRDLIQWEGKCNAQPSQDNREDMMKKLEKGSTNACIRLHLEGHKSNNGKVKGQARNVQSVQNAAVVLKAVRVHECGSAASQCDGATPRQNRKVPKVTKVHFQPKKTLITCFKCKKEGHHVRDCTLKKEEKGMSKIQEKNKMAHVKCSNMGHNASMCSSKANDQATLPNMKIRRSKRKCYGCNKKGHEIASCPYMRDEVLASSSKRLVNKFT
ncbi:uncharacterized protein LOC110432739 [Sorghum bicolor]|uniref:uncharacterized protein LOC110432739 n=1 Tax=Sorghum bicolor TaxID=4558 RepID=UPI000B424789|nr:uncharacterized protein LOC110432739 [Sorghum bicolor]|eukprot:XP_021309208.1 uncharacterized protein LOC110432739 [Sorghum bicolor]